MLTVPVSVMPDIAWPAIPRPEGSMVLALVQQLEHTQWWTPDRLQAMQCWQLARLARHTRENVPFYRDRLGALGNKPLTVDRWRELPILARGEIQVAGDTLRSLKLGPEHGQPEENSTSGSTGMPITILGTAIVALFFNAITIRENLWHGRDFSGSLASIRRTDSGKALYPHGKRNRHWSIATKGLFATGPNNVLNLLTPIDEQAEWLQRQNPDYLLTFPTILEFLARHCLEHGITLPRLRQARTFSEALHPRVREICREAWGVGLTDVYSANEVGQIALQCPEHEHYHIMSERLLVEILDDSGNQCGPGEIGRVVITDMHNFASPLIRYQLGDYAEVGEPCPCGRGLPVLNRIMGRVRNMMTMPSGQLVWPLFGYTGYTDIAPIRQIQYIQKAVSHIELRLVVDGELDAGQEKALKALIVERLDRPVEVTIVCMDEIPRSASGKYEDFMSEVTADGRGGG